MSDNGNFFVAHETFVSTFAMDGTEIGTPVDLGSNTRAVAVVSDSLGGTLEQTIFVTTDANIIEMISPDGTLQQFAPDTILQDPNGLAFLPALIGGGEMGNIFVADTGAGDILKFTKNGDAETFATFGNPNFLAFERGFAYADADPHSDPQSQPDREPQPPSPSPSASPSPTPTPPNKALNLSTRVDVETGTNVGIGGFIINGTDPKLVVDSCNRTVLDRLRRRWSPRRPSPGVA